MTARSLEAGGDGDGSGRPSLDDLEHVLKGAGIDTGALLVGLKTAAAEAAADALQSSPTLPLSFATVSAAMRTHFLPSQLRLEGDVHALLRHCLPAPGDQRRGWQMNVAARRDILARAARSGLLKDVLQSLETDPDDGEADLLRRVLARDPLSLAAMSLEQLTQLDTVASWLEGTELASLPTQEALRREIAHREMIDPFRALVGRSVAAGAHASEDRFVGRAEEMEQLRAYVGLVKPDLLRDRAVRAARSLWSTVTFKDNANEPLPIRGLGGMGKSTLIAKFVLDHALFPHITLPLAYLDFDRAALAPRQPLQLLIEICKQFGLRLPQAEPRLKLLRAQLREAIDSQAANLDRREREKTTRSELKSFCGAVRDIVEGINAAAAPVVVLLDTWEIVEYDEEAVAGVRALMEALRIGSGKPWVNLRIVVAGRGDLSDVETTQAAVVLRQLTRSATIELLARRNASEALELSARQVESLAPALRNSPLDVIAVTNWLREREPGERARLAAELVQDIDAMPEGAAAGELDRQIAILRITAILTQRMINHINDRDVRALAMPGLVVRSVTRQVIRQVMVPASRLGHDANTLPAGAEDRLWHRLARERWLVTRQGEVLRQRPEVRRAMLNLMRESDSGAFSRTNDLAVQFFRTRADEDEGARAELVYHLLLGRLAPLDEIEALWTPGVGRLLAPSVEDLDGDSQRYLKAKLGRSLPAEAMETLPPAVLLAVLDAHGHKYMRSLGPERMLALLDSLRAAGDSPLVTGLCFESMYKAGSWTAIDAAIDRGGRLRASMEGALAALASGSHALERLGEPSLAALRFLLRWGARDPQADSLWQRLLEGGTHAQELLQFPPLALDAAVLLVCSSRRFGAGSGAAQRAGEQVLAFFRPGRRLPDGASGSHAARILAFFELRDRQQILQRVDLDNHFATLSGREIAVFGQLAASLRQLQQQGSNPAASELVDRAETLMRQLGKFPSDVVLAERTLTREFAATLRSALELLPDAAPHVLRAVSLKDPDWIQPLGHALHRAFAGDVPRRLGWWATVEKYLGSGEKPRTLRQSAGGFEILALADEASCLPEAVGAYEKLAAGSSDAAQVADFRRLARAYADWRQMLDVMVAQARGTRGS